MSDLEVWVVAFGDYKPPWVLAIYDNEAAARAHADAQQDGSPLPLEVLPWQCRSTYREERP